MCRHPELLRKPAANGSAQARLTRGRRHRRRAARRIGQPAGRRALRSAEHGRRRPHAENHPSAGGGSRAVLAASRREPSSTEPARGIPLRVEGWSPKPARGAFPGRPYAAHGARRGIPPGRRQSRGRRAPACSPLAAALPAGLGKPQGTGPGRPWTTPAGVGGLEGAPWAAPTAPAPTAPVPQRWAAALYRPAVRRLADSRWPYMHARGVSSAAGSAGWSRAPRAARTCLSAVTTDSMTSTAGRPVAGSKVGMNSSRCHAPCPSPANPAPAQRLQPPLAPASPPLAPGPAPPSAGSRRSCRNKVHGAELALSRAANGRESSSGPRRQWDLNSPWAQPPPCPAAAFGTRARSAGPPAASIPGAGSDAVRKTCGAGWPLQPRTDQPYRSSARAGVVRRGCHGVRREASQQDVGRDVTEHEHARCLRAPSGAAVALRLTRRSWGIWARTAAASSCAHVARQSRIVSAGPPLPRAR